MPVQVTYPGVYVVEALSGSVSISPVATSRALFIGMAQRGPIGTPTLVLSFTSYDKTFGSDTSLGEMSDQVRQFFLNGGGQAYIMRIAGFPVGVTGKASVDLENEFGSSVFRFEAQDPGRIGDTIRLEVDYDTPSPETTFNLTVYREAAGPGGALQQVETEVHRNLETDPTGGRYVVNVLTRDSRLIPRRQPRRRSSRRSRVSHYVACSASARAWPSHGRISSTR